MDSAAPPPPPPPPQIHHMFESCLGCKWTLFVLGRIRAGVCRPGQLTRSAEGLTTKVLNERLAKLMRFGIVERTSYPEVPPRVEYHLTTFGERFVRVLDEIESLADEAPAPASGAAPAL